MVGEDFHTCAYMYARSPVQSGHDAMLLRERAHPQGRGSYWVIWEVEHAVPAIRVHLKWTRVFR